MKFFRIFLSTAVLTLGLMGCVEAPAPTDDLNYAHASRETRFSHWLQWRAQECHLEGLIGKGRWVCSNGRNYEASFRADAIFDSPYTLPRADTPRQALTNPALYQPYRFREAHPYFRWLANDHEVAIGLNFEHWVNWRAVHCRMVGIQSDPIGFQCDNGNFYVARLAVWETRNPGHYMRIVYEVPKAPEKWSDPWEKPEHP